MSLEKKLTANGGKAWQREDNEDRTIPYKKWILEHREIGYFTDVDSIQWKYIGGEPIPIAIIELTACKNTSEASSDGWEKVKRSVPPQSYLDAIVERTFNRDSQGACNIQLGKMLNIPIYLVLFPPQVDWLYVYSYNRTRWHLFEDPEGWADFLRRKFFDK